MTRPTLARVAFACAVVAAFATSPIPSLRAAERSEAIGIVKADEAKKGRDPVYGALQYRLVGPNVGGRVDRVAGIPGDPSTYYFAAAQSGIWKTDDAGHSWKPIFEDQPTQSTGSIAVAPSDPNVLYVGSGEANIRGNVAIGLGIFKSTDAGKSWTQVWKTHGQVGTLIVHPNDPDTVYAAVLGSPFGPGRDRGIYRSRDGGKSWQKVLYRDADSGGADIAFDPSNPRILLASLWQTRRTPWNLTSGGPGSGLFRSTDGGDSWKAIEFGELKTKAVAAKPGEPLPTPAKGAPDVEPIGKIGVAFAPSLPSRVYALVEAEHGGLFRSDDGGETFKRINESRSLRQRAWYYSTLVVDPVDPDVVWFPQVNLQRSIDGGKSVQSAQEGLHHGDNHDVWIDPKNPERMIVGNDGGVDLTTDGGRTWSSPDLPLGQFYNVAVDDRVPYHLGGTVQDEGTASGPSRALNAGGNLLALWKYVGGGESGDFVYDPVEPGQVYAGEYGGYLSHYDERTAQLRSITAYPFDPSGHGAVDAQYRFQWTAPVATSPHDPKVLYHGANVLFMTRDRGMSWTAISPDLTRNDPSKQQWSGGPITGDNTTVEFYDTIFSVAESPRVAGTIWVGSDDGLVHLTRDGGKNWTAVTPGAVPAWSTVECITPSRWEDGTAYVAVDAHRLDDHRPYLFKTRDFGKSWQRLDQGLPADMSVLTVKEDERDPQLLYLGGERGVFLSRDGGARFEPLKLNLPAVAVTDLETRHDDLIVATRGRALWILEDLDALRHADAAARAAALQLWPGKPAPRWRMEGRWSDAAKIDDAPVGAVLSYWLKDAPAGELALEISDADGKLVRTLSSVPKPPRFAEDDPDEPTKPAEPELTKEQGFNRIVWDLRHREPRRLEKAKTDIGNPEIAPMAAPGTYHAKLTVDVGLPTARSVSADLVVTADPRLALGVDDIRTNVAFSLGIRDAMDRALDLIDNVRATREQVSELGKRLGTDPARKNLVEQSVALAKRCDDIEARLHNPKAEVVYDILAQRGGAKLYSQLAFLIANVDSSDSPPTAAQRQRYNALDAEIGALRDEVAKMRATDIANLEQALEAAKVPRIVLPH